MELQIGIALFVLLISIGIHLTMTYDPPPKVPKIVNAIVDDEPAQLETQKQKIKSSRTDEGVTYDLSGCENGNCTL